MAMRILAYLVIISSLSLMVCAEVNREPVAPPHTISASLEAIDKLDRFTRDVMDDDKVNTISTIKRRSSLRAELTNQNDPMFLREAEKHLAEYWLRSEKSPLHKSAYSAAPYLLSLAGKIETTNSLQFLIDHLDYSPGPTGTTGPFVHHHYPAITIIRTERLKVAPLLAQAIMNDNSTVVTRRLATFLLKEMANKNLCEYFRENLQPDVIEKRPQRFEAYCRYLQEFDINDYVPQDEMRLHESRKDKVWVPE